MYKIPCDFDCKELINEHLNCIGFGVNYVILHFNKGFIQFSGKFIVKNNFKTKSYDEVFPLKHDFGLLLFLNKKIIAINISNNQNNLELIFEESLNIELIGDKFYESFIVNINQQEVII